MSLRFQKQLPLLSSSQRSNQNTINGVFIQRVTNGTMSNSSNHVITANGNNATEALTATTTRDVAIGDDDNNTNYVYIPFNGIPVDKITDTFIIALSGHQDPIKNQALKNKIFQYKAELRKWAGNQIKAQLVNIAMTLLQDQSYSDVTVLDSNGNQQGIKTFNDFRSWWSNCEGTDMDNKTYQEICYGWWKKNKGWELRWETEWMTGESLGNNWKYEENSITKAINESKKAGGSLKGCVAKTISHKKVEIIKSIQKSAVAHCTKVTKKRMQGSHLDEFGKYKKQQPSEYVVSKVTETTTPQKKKKRRNRSAMSVSSTEG
jgi:hypothetical protein